MPSLRVLYIHLVHEGGERDDDPCAVVVRPEGVTARVLSAANCVGYSDCGS